MKRFIALLLTLILCVSLCACGGSEPPEPTPTPTPAPTPVPTLSPEELAAKYDADMAAAIGSDDRAPLTAGKAVTYWVGEDEVGTYNTKFLADEWIAEAPDEAKYIVQRTEGTKTVGFYTGVGLGCDALQPYVRIHIINSVSKKDLASETFLGEEPPAVIHKVEERIGAYPDDAEIEAWINTTLAEIDGGQKDAALTTAQSYLKPGGCSKAYLELALLTEQGFTSEETAYAVENCGADWNKQVLDYTKKNLSGNYSRLTIYNLLTEQRLFTKEEANYAIDNCGANWKKLALNNVKDYLSTKNYSRSELYHHLTNGGGFTEEEANYALDNCGVKWDEMQDDILTTALEDMEKRHMYSQAEFAAYLVEYNKYSEEDAKAAAEAIDVDWNVQAVKCAEYLLSDDYGAGFSYDRLISWMSEDIAEYGKGFTLEQAQYGADHVTADWNAQAAKSIVNMVDYWDESIYGELNEENLFWTLTELDGFTEEQAKHAITTVDLP